MKSVSSLPEGYEEIYSVDLQKNKRMMLLINAMAFLIAVTMVVPTCFFVPITVLFDMKNGIVDYFVRFAALLVLLLLYIVLHEFVHGIAMKICGTKKVKYGFTGPYAYAGSEDYYGKGAYIFIALAPVVLWGIVLLVVNFFVPPEWFWVIYIIQITNVSGAAGDLFLTVRFLGFPKDILIRDYGVGMTVYKNEDRSCKEKNNL